MNPHNTPVIAAFALILAGCSGSSEPPSSAGGPAQHAPIVTNRIDIPAAVRQNLGITFATVERRAVRQTIRLPGEFELRPEARREFRAMASGRATLHVTQFQVVQPGVLLLTLDSPQWRDLQHEAVEAEGDIQVAQAALDVAIAQLQETKGAADFTQKRLESLRQADLRNVQLEADLAELLNSMPRLEAEITAKRVNLQEAHEHFRSRLNSLASLSGLSVEQLTQPSPSESETEVAARWRTMGQLQVHSDISGVVESIDVTNGGWMETGGLALAVVDPTAIRFRAQALQSDMSRIREEQAAQIVLPQSAGFDPQEALSAKLTIGFRASSELRTIPVYAIPSSLPAWAKPGVSAFLEVFLIGADASQLAIPASAVVRDGLVPVIFRRDPANSDKVIRMEADLGVGDGRWIEIRSGVRQGDEVVLDGAYQLMLASSGSAQKGGHFHADGTFHADDHEDK